MSTGFRGWVFGCGVEGLGLEIGIDGWEVEGVKSRTITSQQREAVPRKARVLGS